MPDECYKFSTCEKRAGDPDACDIHCLDYASTAYMAAQAGDGNVTGDIIVSKSYARDILGMAEELASIQRLEKRWRLLAEACLLKYPELGKDFNIC